VGEQVSASASRNSRGSSEFVLVNVAGYSISVARELIPLVDKVVLDVGHGCDGRAWW
jgi:hypothetical protein